MSKYKIWDRNETIWVPGVNPKTGKSFFTPEQWIEENPWLENPATKMIILNSTLNGAVALNFEMAREQYKRAGAKINDNMTDQEILDSIEDFENNPPGSDEPTSEERTAAALEFLAISNLPDEY